MSLTPSTMLELGHTAPTFALPDVISGQTITLSDLSDGRALLVLFICSHCPFVKLVEQELAHIAADYAEKGLKTVAISANDVDTYEEDSPAKMKEQAQALAFSFPYCYDETQEVAKSYRAACTPDLYLFDADLKLVYRGQLDDARPGNNQPVTGKDLRGAIDATLAGQALSPDQSPATGCNIKWKPGNEPDYFG